MAKPFAEIGNRLRVARVALVGDAHGSQAKFAEGAGIKPRAYNNWEVGTSRISTDGAIALRAAYGLPMDWIYCGGMVDRLPSTVQDALRSRPASNS